MALRDLGQFFSHLNDIDFEYVVLRNWENLPFNVQVGPHSDLDLLVYDYDHFKEVFDDDLEEVYPLPRVQHKIKFENGDYVFCDVRFVGDNYYPIDFEVEMLKSREFNSRGFWTPNPVFHRIALAYHVAHHKGINKYERHLGNVKPEELLDALKKSPIGWVAPDDPTVGRYNAYYSGATSHAEILDNGIRKKQYRFKNHNLIKNEGEILKKITSEHFPKVIDITDEYIDIEDCGEPLNEYNLPDNWEEQLNNIIKELRVHGVVHRDIRLENLMVKDDVIKLIDFGWAKYKEDEDKAKLPDLLGFPNKAPWGFDDAYSMGKVKKQIKSWEDELCEY